MVNHFSIMLQRRFREQERGEDEEDEGEKPGKKKKKGGGRGGDLRIHDLEEDLEMSSDDSDSSMGDGKDVQQWHINPLSRQQQDGITWFSFFHPLFNGAGGADGESKTSSKKDKSKGKKKKKRKSNDEALEDSDDGDYEGLEVDYMSDESRSDPSRYRTLIHNGQLIIQHLGCCCFH